MTAPRRPDDLLDQIERALKSATPGPWKITQGFLSPRHVVGGNRYILEPADQYPTRDADASLVAHAPEWLQALVGRLRQTERENEKLREIVAMDADEYDVARHWHGGPPIKTRLTEIIDQRDTLEAQVATLRKALSGAVNVARWASEHGLMGASPAAKEWEALAGVGSPTGAPQP